MCGYEAEGSAAIVRGEKIDKPETLATAIRIGNPASWQPAEAARDESGGRIDSVTDDEIVAAYQFIASNEGVLCEPSSAASVAGLFKAASLGQVSGNGNIVCILTGNGLKDPDSAIQYGKPERAQLPSDADQVAKFFGLSELCYKSEAALPDSKAAFAVFTCFRDSPSLAKLCGLQVGRLIAACPSTARLSSGARLAGELLSVPGCETMNLDLNTGFI